MNFQFLSNAACEVIAFPPHEPMLVRSSNSQVKVTGDLDDFIDSIESNIDLSQPIERYESPIMTEAKSSALHQQRILWGALQMGAIPFPQADVTANDTPDFDI